MTVIVTKDAINLREKLSELDKETGIKGEELMRADTSAEAREALQLDQQLFTDFESTGIDDNATSTQLTVSDSGIDVTGTAKINGLTVENTAGATLNINTALQAADSKILLHEGTTASPSNGASIRYDGAANLFKIGVGASVDTTRLSIDRNTGDISFYEDTGTTAKLFWDASAESLGIGASSPAASMDIRSPNTAVQSRGNLYVTTTSTAAINEGAQISLGGTYTGAAETFFGAIAGRKENATVSDFNAYLQFSVRNTGGMSEKMRIDSSGHAIIPNGVTLGTAAGTYNAANTLDDYEEGTWTAVYSPSVSSFGTITMTTFVGDAPSYVKIGRMVTVTAVMSTYDLTIGAASGDVRISGLPFTIDKSGAATISDTIGWAGQNPLSGSILGNDDIKLKYRSLVDGDDVTLNVTDLTTGSGMSNSNYLKFTLTYMTDA